MSRSSELTCSSDSAPGAQRLTASKVCPGRKRRKKEMVWKCSTPYGIKGMSRLFIFSPFTRFLGAQRLTASKVCPVLARRTGTGNTLTCSTPYGIKGMSSESLYQLRLAVSKVLNALRHQRYVQCRFCLHYSLLPTSAQRLTASKVCPES